MNRKIPYVSDIIPTEEIKTWGKENYLVTGKTGTGKSVWALEVLGNYAKESNQKVLMLENRRGTVKQLKDKISKLDLETNVIVTTYQAIESVVLRQGEFNFKEFNYIVFDEWHYFLSDSNFNNYTDLSLNYLLEDTQDSSRIFMSATDDEIKEFNDEVLKLRFKKHFSVSHEISNISKIVEYNHKDDFDNLIHDTINYCIDNKEKVIIFVNDTIKLQKLIDKYTNYRDMDLCYTVSKSNQLYDEESALTMNDIVDDESFYQTVLFTTEVLSTGISIIDKKLKHMIIDTTDTDSIIQSIGRKRLSYTPKGNLDFDDTMTVYLPSHSKGSIAQSIRRAEESIYVCDYLKANGSKKFTSKVVRDCFSHQGKKIWINSQLIYNNDGSTSSVPKVNYIKYYNYKLRLNELNKKILSNKTQGQFISQKLKLRCQIEKYVSPTENVSLINLLKKYEGIPMYNKSEVRESFIDELGLRRKHDNRLIKSLDTIDSYVKEATEGLYKVSKGECRKKTSINFRKKFWKVKISSD